MRGQVVSAPWLDKRGIAGYLSCSVRSIESALTEGMPHAVIFGRVKFQVVDVEDWLEHAGHLQRRGDATDTLPADNELARQRANATGPRHEEGRSP
jgi:hypothetical protein